MKRRANLGCRIPNMFEAALDGEFKGLYIEGEDIAQSDSEPSMSPRRSPRWSASSCKTCSERVGEVRACIPARLVFLEKDGTFTTPSDGFTRPQSDEAESGYADWNHAVALQRRRLPDEITTIRRRSWMRLAPDSDLHRRELRRIDELAASQWPCNAEHPEGTPTCILVNSCAARESSLVTDTCLPRRKSMRGSP